MAWDFTQDRPIYLQLIEQIKLRIISGIYKAGDKLPDVRERAADESVTSNTMQKALTELEREELIYTQRTSGKYITEDEGKIMSLKENLAAEQIKEFLNKMKSLGFNNSQTLSLVDSIIKGEKK